jgi:ribosome-associated protein
MPGVLKEIARIADEMKAGNVRCYELDDPSVSDFVVIITVNNQIHCKAVYESISACVTPILDEEKSGDFFAPLRVSGEAKSGWMILDMNSIIVHLLLEDVREFYEIDELFSKRGTVYHY